MDKAALTSELKQAREKLLRVRDLRIRPAKDDKILLSWNALAISAFANAARHLQEPGYLSAAQQAANFLLESLRRKDGRLLHTWRHGQAKLDAYLDDYACLIDALISLYYADFDPSWIEQAVELARIMVDHFAADEGGFYFTADDHEQLLVRTKDVQDSSVPSGNSMAATALIRLGRLSGNQEWIERGEATIRIASALIERAPMAVGQMLVAMDLLLSSNEQWVLLADNRNDDFNQLVVKLQKKLKPQASMIMHTTDHRLPACLQDIIDGKTVHDHEPTLYICADYTCQAPIVGLDNILNHLEINQKVDA